MKLTTNKVIKEITSLGCLFILIFAIKSSFFGNFTVPTPSMRHTIEVGDKLVANMICYNLRVPFTKKIIFSFYKPERGEVIVFDNPKNESISFVKRLIGVPGDIIEVTDGFITVNGKALKTNLTDEARENLDLTGGVYQETNHRGVSYQVRRLPRYQRRPHMLGYQKFVLGENEYFAMGDNRDESSDSREWGFVPFANIRGRAMFIYYSSYHPDYLNTWFFEPPHSIRWNRFFKVLK